MKWINYTLQFFWVLLIIFILMNFLMLIDGGFDGFINEYKKQPANKLLLLFGIYSSTIIIIIILKFIKISKIEKTKGKIRFKDTKLGLKLTRFPKIETLEEYKNINGLIKALSFGVKHWNGNEYSNYNTDAYMIRSHALHVLRKIYFEINENLSDIPHFVVKHIDLNKNEDLIKNYDLIKRINRRYEKRNKKILNSLIKCLQDPKKSIIQIAATFIEEITEIGTYESYDSMKDWYNTNENNINTLLLNSLKNRRKYELNEKKEKNEKTLPMPSNIQWTLNDLIVGDYYDESSKKAMEASVVKWRESSSNIHKYRNSETLKELSVKWQKQEIFWNIDDYLTYNTKCKRCFAPKEQGKKCKFCIN
jgi:hypothetical protein